MNAPSTRSERGYVELVGRFRWRGWIENDEEYGMATEYECRAWSRIGAMSKLRAYISAKDAQANTGPEQVKLRGAFRS